MSTTLVRGRQINNPHGTFYSLATQAISNIAAVQAIALEKEEDKHELTHSTVTNNSRIYVQFTGSYEIIISGVCDVASGAAGKYIEVWIAIDGTPVTDSNTRVNIVNLSSEMTVVVPYILDLTAGQYIEIMTWGSATTVQWVATAAGTSPDRPATPSMIVTMKQINGY